MYEYIKGKVTDIQSGYIVLENNGIGYLIYTANPYSFNIDEEYKLYVYQYIREDENTLYGFKSYEEKDLFLRLDLLFRNLRYRQNGLFCTDFVRVNYKCGVSQGCKTLEKQE